jgi:hypothetical protein
MAQRGLMVEYMWTEGWLVRNQDAWMHELRQSQQKPGGASSFNDQPKRLIWQRPRTAAPITTMRKGEGYLLMAPGNLQDGGGSPKTGGLV